MQKEINLKVLFGVLKRRMRLILIISAITTVLAGLYSLSLEAGPPRYQSSASILLSGEVGANTTLEVILRDPVVLDSVVEELGLAKSSSELNSQIDFSSEGGRILKIFAVDSNPELAAEIANSTANNFTKQLGSILGMYETKVLSEAQVSSTPVFVDSVSILKFIIGGFAAGFIISIGVVLFLDSLNETIQSEREIEQLLALPAIGYVSKIDKKNINTQPGQRSEKKRRGVKSGAKRKG
ncbi:YveK family protein [Bacillus dakarensis]|uniref:YveK family protein n=1 Tax=Robertmurraya dakarensis TaxID=1926278 RepID=UPI00098093BB|nr:Wzz/FepE/Etk N-terminal domain-containing protein [Bacillus dakarensis]